MSLIVIFNSMIINYNVNRCLKRRCFLLAYSILPLLETGNDPECGCIFY